MYITDRILKNSFYKNSNQCDNVLIINDQNQVAAKTEQTLYDIFDALGYLDIQT